MDRLQGFGSQGRSSRQPVMVLPIGRIGISATTTAAEHRDRRQNFAPSFSSAARVAQTLVDASQVADTELVRCVGDQQTIRGQALQRSHDGLYRQPKIAGDIGSGHLQTDARAIGQRRIGATANLNDEVGDAFVGRQMQAMQSLKLHRPRLAVQASQVFVPHCALGAIGLDVLPATPPVETVRQSFGRAELSASVRHVEDFSRESEAAYHTMIVGHKAVEGNGTFHQVEDVISLVVLEE